MQALQALGPQEHFYFNQDGAQFGSALAAADFDGDGITDLAIGAWNGGSPSQAASAKGAVMTWKGSAAKPISFTVDSNWTGASGGDRYGFALAAGDFNGDAAADLAIGVPGHNLRGKAPATLLGDTGELVMLWGAAGIGLGTETSYGKDVFLAIEAQAEPEAGDEFGYSLAVGDLDGDGIDDLAVGAPFDNTHPIGSIRGAAYVFRGDAADLVPAHVVTTATSTELDGSVGGSGWGSTLAFGPVYGLQTADTLLLSYPDATRWFETASAGVITRLVYEDDALQPVDVLYQGK